ncbi:MAG TPA: YfiR family protein [Armatimonadota bacterium]|nr:YfiR family protein [Armatimonadota bacterium]
MVFKGIFMNRRVCSLIVAVAICAVLGLADNCHGKSRPAAEYQVKAAYIYNFAKFVEWPSKVFSNANSPIIIGVLGDDPFGDTLEQTIKDKTVNGRRLQVRRFDKTSDVGVCHMLFVSSSEKMRLSKALDRVKDSNVLTIGEMGGFARQGGMIGFTMEGNKVGFEINLERAKKAGLNVSSQLLKVAKVVR